SYVGGPGVIVTPTCNFSPPRGQVARPIACMPLAERSAPPAIAETVAGLRATFDSGATRPLAWRKEQLARLIAMIEDNEPALLDALARDLGRPAFEGWISETHYVAGEARYALAHLRSW